MARTIKCPQCGALMSIPATGLEMTCEYCGLASPAPDADKRRRRMEREAEKRRKAEQKARRVAERAAERPERGKPRHRRSILGRLVALPFKLAPLALIGVAGYYLVYQPLRGDTGTARFRSASAELVARGYRPVTEPKVATAFALFGADLFLDLKRGRCYGLVVGAGERIERVEVRGRRRLTQTPLQPQVTLLHCASRTATIKALVRFKWGGRFTWGLFERRRAPVPEAKTRPRPKKRRRRRRRRVRKPIPKVSRPHEPPAKRTDPVEPLDPQEIAPPAPIKLPDDELVD